MTPLLLAVLLIAAEDPAPPAVYEVVRAGDREMSCETLIAEINGLNAELQAQQQRQADTMNEAVKDTMGAMSGGGMAGGILSSLAGQVPFGSQALSLGRQAQMAAAQRKMTEQIASAQEDAIAMTPKYQRLDHLMGLYESKAC